MFDTAGVRSVVPPKIQTHFKPNEDKK
jgi:hypothetical protein